MQSVAISSYDLYFRGFNNSCQLIIDNQKDCIIDSHIASRKFLKISFALEINEIREHSHMTSDVFWAFLIYLPKYPNQILYYIL